MVKKIAIITILILFTIIYNALHACPVCPENNANNSSLILNNGQNRANNPKFEKIKQILAAMKNQE